MSAALQASLKKLDQAVNKLEDVIDTKTKAAKDGQTDLFGAMTSSRKSNDNSGSIDTQLLAQKLDSAIEKVEKMLQEG